MLCMVRTFIASTALASLFVGCPQGHSPDVAPTQQEVAESASRSVSEAKSIAGLDALDPDETAALDVPGSGWDPILDDNYESRIFAPISAVVESASSAAHAPNVFRGMRANQPQSSGWGTAPQPPLSPAFPSQLRWESLQIAGFQLDRLPTVLFQ